MLLCWFWLVAVFPALGQDETPLPDSVEETQSPEVTEVIPVVPTQVIEIETVPTVVVLPPVEPTIGETVYSEVLDELNQQNEQLAAAASEVAQKSNDNLLKLAAVALILLFVSSPPSMGIVRDFVGRQKEAAAATPTQIDDRFWGELDKVRAVSEQRAIEIRKEILDQVQDLVLNSIMRERDRGAAETFLPDEPSQTPG